MKRLFLILALLLTGTACAHTGATPDSTLHAFTSAVLSHDYESAYQFLSANTRSEISLEQFIERIEMDLENTRLITERLGRADLEEEITAILEINHEETIELIYENGQFHIVGNIIDPCDQSTPQGAIRSFVRAYQNRQYEILLALAPQSVRETLTIEQLQQWIDTNGAEYSVNRDIEILSEQMDAPIEIHGDRATMAYGENNVVQLIREDGKWKIEDID